MSPLLLVSHCKRRHRGTLSTCAATPLSHNGPKRFYYLCLLKLIHTRRGQALDLF